MKLRITTRLFLALLAMGAAVVVAMGTAAHFSLVRGFLGYVNEQSMQRLEATIPRIVAAYEEHGSWDFVREEPRAWIHVLGLPVQHDWENDDSVPWVPPVSELTGAILRWTLLDEQHRRLAGYAAIRTDALERPLVVGGRTVGYVAMAPFQNVAAVGAQRFERRQFEASLGVGALALCLAALIAGWVTVALLRPVQRVARATARLAKGEYATRVAIHGQDEVGVLAADFNHLAETLQKNAVARRSFFTDVSHELRTPLAVLQGELEAMEDGVRPLTPEAVKSLLSEVYGLSQLVGDLHDFALADAGSLSYRMECTDLGAVLRESVEVFHTRMRERGLKLELNVPEQPLCVNADPARLRQVFHNLLENATRYTNAGGRVQLHAARERDVVLVEMQDSAPGVLEHELPLLFDRFYRSGRPGARPAGSGLGLAICRAVAEAHRGRIQAAVSPLGGLCIALRLPALD